MEAKEVAKRQVSAPKQELANHRGTLTQFMLSVIDRLKAEKKHSAVGTYGSTLNSFTRFAGQEPVDGMALEAVFTSGRLKEYQAWLRQQGKKWNTVSTYMRTLKAVYNRYCEPGSLGHNPKLFDGVYTRVESQTKRALEEDEAGRLMTADADCLSPRVQGALGYCRLMFLFRGMPFIDLAYLRKQDLRGDKLVYCRHKTGRQITVRIPPEAYELFETYRDRNPASTYLFPILDDTLKDDAQLHRQYLRALRCFNKQLQVVARVLLPGAKLSSYTPRHTWATLAFHNNVPIGVISKALGHSSIKVTETYLKPFEDEKVDVANEALIVAVVKKKPGIKDGFGGCRGFPREKGLLTK